MSAAGAGFHVADTDEDGIWDVDEETPCSDRGVYLYNSILWAQGVGPDLYLDTGAEADITYTCWDMDTSSPGTFSASADDNADPEFVNPGAANYRLDISASDYTDAGHNDLIGTDFLDLDEDGQTDAEPLPLDLDLTTRVQGGTVDWGAYENE